jgi:hypothetical protein
LIHERNIPSRHSGAGHGNPAKQNPVANQRRHQRRDFGADALVPKIEETDEQIAEGDALQDAVDAQVRQ